MYGNTVNSVVCTNVIKMVFFVTKSILYLELMQNPWKLCKNSNVLFSIVKMNTFLKNQKSKSYVVISTDKIQRFSIMPITPPPPTYKHCLT